MLIPLGYHCNITQINIQLKIKKDTGAFEWFESKKLQYITDLINILTDNPNENVIFGKNYYLYLLNINFYSRHYSLDEYTIIFKRRYERFLEILNKEENIFFVRINPLNKNTTKNEIELFIESIKKINNKNKISFLLIDTIINEEEFITFNINIDNVSFHHKYFFQTDIGDNVYLTNNNIVCEKYKKFLIDIGYYDNI